VVRCTNFGVGIPAISGALSRREAGMLRSARNIGHFWIRRSGHCRAPEVAAAAIIADGFHFGSGSWAVQAVLLTSALARVFP